MNNDFNNLSDDDPICPKCGYKIKPWARVKCDGCGKPHCKSHRPWFDFSGEKPVMVKYWLCDACKKNFKSVVKSPNH
jgi:predicted amidophosphoribosyltransferase